jgi:excisionase family DNA binding protein
MAQIMTTKELAEYLNLHKIIACEYAAKGRMPAIRIGRVWRGGEIRWRWRVY